MDPWLNLCYRFIYIKFPFSYEKTVTKVRTVITVIVVWLLSIFVALLPLAGFGQITLSYTLETCMVNLFGETSLTRNINYVIFLIALGVIPVIVIVITNIWIMFIARKQIRKIYHSTSREDKRERKQIQKVKNKKQVALLKVFGGILIANFITWTPVILHSVVSTQTISPFGFLCSCLVLSSCIQYCILSLRVFSFLI